MTIKAAANPAAAGKPLIYHRDIHLAGCPIIKKYRLRRLTNTTFSDTDFGVVGIVLGNMAQFMDKGIITLTITGIFALLVIYNFAAKKKVPVEEGTGQ